MMFCRFCGAPTPVDSRFCPKCGKRIAGDSPRSDAIARRLWLRTPYPYAAILILAFLTWAFQPRSTAFEYETVRLSIELDGRSSAPEQSLYRHHFSLVVENIGEEAIAEVPVELRAEVLGRDGSPTGSVRVDSEFLGRRLPLVVNDRSDPLIVVLTDDLAPGDKRRYTIDGIVTGAPPFDVRYQLIDQQSGDVLADVTVGEPAGTPGTGPDADPGAEPDPDPALQAQSR